MTEVKYLTKEEIIRIHNEIIENFGGTEGLLNEGLLEIVMEQMKVSKDIIQKSITLLFGIIKNHPFIDGNKRTALESFYTFLNYNSIHFKIEDINKAEDIILKIAKDEISKNLVRKWIEDITSD
ncbi:MAG: type II toxin-antitoxin system death-on-curing family toxin [Candidatus Aenigmarchaeota archaeon]|nr:type II toxin-antitoxin system death-on-curing family toxin [Candidatus Aenigmarchaeota archaeon]